MNLIYKYKIGPDTQVLNILKDAKFLSIHLQQGEPHMWFLFDNANAFHQEERIFRTVGTGWRWDPEPDEKYLGTFVLDHDGLVFHVFELPNASY